MMKFVQRVFHDKSGTTAHPKIQGPSMEEILASVRRIISEDGGSQLKEDAVPSSTPAEKANTAVKADVPERIETVDEYGTVTKVEKNTSTAPAESSPPPPAKPQIETLLSEETAAASFSSLAELASAVTRQEMTHTDVPLDNSNRTLESLVVELLRPTLREWLDKNLPSVIDRMVRREIEKLVRRTEDRQSPFPAPYRA